MDMFALDTDVAAWEAALLPLHGPDRLAVLMPLAWHLRQRDTNRATLLAAEGQALLPQAQLTTEEKILIAARLQLVQAEATLMAGQLEEAGQITTIAYDQLHALGDLPGCADAHWLRSWIAIDGGDHQHGVAELASMAQLARDMADPQRIAIAEAVTARWAVLSDPHAAAQRWTGHFNPEQQTPAVSTWVHDFLGQAASQASDFGAAARHYLASYEAALASGQLRPAITAAINLGLNFTILNDHHAALEWMQSALDLARPAGWPRSVGATLVHTADTMRRLGRLDAAEELLREALDILAPLSAGRSYGSALHFLGDLALDKGEHERALTAFRQLESRADALQQADFQAEAQRGQAHALCFLAQPQAALAAANRAVELAVASANRYNHVAALRVLALIHRHHELPAPDGMREAKATLHYLKQALATAAAIDGYTLPADLHEALAQEYARAGDYAQAYHAAQAAAAAREKTHSQEATSRAIAMQVHHQTEQARAEGRYHRELAEAEARRNEELQQASATLQQAYRQLKEAQTQLIAQEKLAALGALMAGVAHELNTPIGNSLLIASTLLHKTDDLERQMNGPGLRRSELAAYVADTRAAHKLVMRGLTSAADLVNSFKQVAVDRTTEQRRPFNLHQVTHEVVATMMNRIRADNHHIEYDVPEHIQMDSYPGPYGQVIANFINNALLHAFSRERRGSIWLAVTTPVAGRVLLAFRDNGCGIAPEHMSRIFDPFFTTKLGQGGSGLGLSISYNIVTSLLGGKISVRSAPSGTTFTLDLPVVAPQQADADPAQIYH